MDLVFLNFIIGCTVSLVSLPEVIPECVESPRVSTYVVKPLPVPSKRLSSIYWYSVAFLNCYGSPVQPPDGPALMSSSDESKSLRFSSLSFSCNVFCKVLLSAESSIKPFVSTLTLKPAPNDEELKSAVV